MSVEGPGGELGPKDDNLESRERNLGGENWSETPVEDDFVIWGSSKLNEEEQTERKPNSLYLAEINEGRDRTAFGIGERMSTVEILLGTGITSEIDGKQREVKHIRIDLGKDGIPLSGACDLDGAITNIDPETAYDLMRNSGVWDSLCRAPARIKEQCPAVREDTTINFGQAHSVVETPETTKGRLQEPMVRYLVTASVVRKTDPGRPGEVQLKRVIGLRAAPDTPGYAKKMVYRPLNLSAAEPRTQEDDEQIYDQLSSIEEELRQKKQ